MPSVLLQTKLGLPHLRSPRVPRPRLDERLARILGHRVTLVCAPAGYGKTTVVGHWLAESGVPAAWFSLDESDNDPVCFKQYLFAALRAVTPADHLDETLGVPMAHRDDRLDLWINALAERTDPFVLALDDLHVIEAAPILELLTFLIENAPPAMHVVLLSRTDPPLPFARFHARNELLDLRAGELRFSTEEIALFLNRVMQLNLSCEDLAAMETRTEGWIAGLQLAALSMQGCPDTHGFVAAFTGSHRYIVDYLVEQVLQLQSERVRSFLLATSILDRLCGALCEALAAETGSETVDGQATLETLERQNLFLAPLDADRQWYRFHPLFADMLRKRLAHLDPQRVAPLHRRASLWHEQNGLMPEAIRHALAAQDWERAYHLVDENGCALLMRGELVTLLQWIQAVEAHAPMTPWLTIQKAWALLLTGQQHRVPATLDAAEQLVSALQPSAEVRTMRGAIIAARAHQANGQGDTGRAAELARLALEQLTDSDPFSCSLCSAVTSILGDTSRMNGDLEQARRAYTQASRIGQAANDLEMVIVANSDLADILMEQGALHQAARLYTETAELAARAENRVTLGVQELYAGLGLVSLEWNDLEAATRYAQQYLAFGMRYGSRDLDIVGHLLLARVELARGLTATIPEPLRTAEQLLRTYDLPPSLSHWVPSSLARLWLAQGDLERGSFFVHDKGIGPDDEIPYRREPEYLVLLRVLLAQADHAAALTLSERLREKAEATNRLRRVIETLVLQALALQGNKVTAQALATLDRAVALAQPEGYLRVFLDEGEPLARLLYAMSAPRRKTGYAQELLSAFSRGSQPTPQPPLQLVEPLSAREIQVLGLIRDGCSNQEIAAQLVISIKTVKRHISNIHTKLGVKSRTQALAAARELGLVQ